MSASPDNGCGAGRASWQVTGEAFRAAVESGRLDLPLPGSGRTRARWAAFADLAGEDLSVARLAEGHADAVAILPELEARRDGANWRLRGTKRYCSGARICTHALVTAIAPDGKRLFAVDTTALAPVPGSWPATGMAGSDTLDVHFADVPGQPVGAPGGYVERPG